VKNDQERVLVDTKTSGVAPSIHAIELATQRMQGWERTGPPLCISQPESRDLAPGVSGPRPKCNETRIENQWGDS
jgi:hypothetical protein